MLGVEGEHDITKFFEVIKKSFGFDQPSAATPITLVSASVVEDEVTYAIIHRVLIPSGFRIVAISYPGAQGGYAVLPDGQLGRAQPRNYHDVIALPPTNGSGFDALVNESKGAFIQSEVEADVAKLLPYKEAGSNNYKGALQNLLIRAQITAEDFTLQTIMIGVSFGVGTETQTSWNPGTVDFVFCIINRDRWRIGIFNRNLISVIKQMDGDTNFPQCFSLGKSKCLNQPLFQ